MDRNEAIAKIKAGLKARTKTRFSVTGGRGTAYGWIFIDAIPTREKAGMGDKDRAELATLLGLASVHPQGVSIPAGSDYRDEYVARAEGRTPERFGEPYWD